LEIPEVYSSFAYLAKGYLTEGILANPTSQIDLMPQAGELGGQGSPSPPRLHQSPLGFHLLARFGDVLEEIDEVN